MLIQTRRGVYDTQSGKIVAATGDRKTKAHPHGWVGDERVRGFWFGLRSGNLPHRFQVRCEHRCCDRSHLTLLIPKP